MRLFSCQRQRKNAAASTCVLVLVLPVNGFSLRSAFEGQTSLMLLQHSHGLSCFHTRGFPLKSNENDGGESESKGGEVIPEPLFRVDDGGSDLTDRFKYKVNALMGVFDPQGKDDENQEGNILNAMLNFPVRYSFTAVGRTNGMENEKEIFIQKTKDIVASGSGDSDNMECRVTPRGKNFTRVTIQVSVDSAAVVNSIYGELKKMDMVVMAY